jgi:hypothetical protein
MFIPFPRIRIFPSWIQGQKDPGSRVKGIADPVPHQRIKVFLTQKTVSKLSEKLFGMYISDPDIFSFLDPDPGSRGNKALDPG